MQRIPAYNLDDEEDEGSDRILPRRNQKHQRPLKKKQQLNPFFRVSGHNEIDNFNINSNSSMREAPIESRQSFPPGATQDESHRDPMPARKKPLLLPSHKRRPTVTVDKPAKVTLQSQKWKGGANQTKPWKRRQWKAEVERQKAVAAEIAAFEERKRIFEEAKRKANIEAAQFEGEKRDHAQAITNTKSARAAAVKVETPAIIPSSVKAMENRAVSVDFANVTSNMQGTWAVDFQDLDLIKKGFFEDPFDVSFGRNDTWNS